MIDGGFNQVSNIGLSTCKNQTVFLHRSRGHSVWAGELSLSAEVFEVATPARKKKSSVSLLAN